MDTTIRTTRAADTRQTILTVAERLYAERGVFAVSNRQISEAAGQGNNTAVGYHFGTRTDLVKAIVQKNASRIELLRIEMLERHRGSTDLRDWISCLVRPSTEYLGTLESSTWYARFSAQVITDPTLRPIMYEYAMASSSLRTVVAEMNTCIPSLPEHVRAARSGMARTLMTHVTAERERELADGALDRVLDRGASWHECGTELIDALMGLWSAPDSSGDRAIQSNEH